MIVCCGKNSMEAEGGMSVMQCLLALGVDVKGMLAVQQQGRVLELTDLITRPGELRPLTLADEEGRRIYERSLRFVLLLAFRRLMPGQRVRIEYSVGGGLFLYTPGHELTEADCAAVEAEMRRIVAADLPFDKREWSLDDAIAYFEADGQPDKVELLKRRPVPFFNMYGLHPAARDASLQGGMASDSMWEYFYGAMVRPPGMCRCSVFSACRDAAWRC